MNFYLDIDGVLIDYNTDTYAKGAIELIEYITSEFDFYWLTTHCKGDAEPAIEYLSEYFLENVVEKLRKVKPTYWEVLKTEGIDFDSKFIWLDDYPFNAELSVLENFGVSDPIYLVNLANENELESILAHIKDMKAKIRKRRMTFLYTLLSLILAIILGKTIWMCIAISPLGDFETEKEDILKRRNYI